MRETEFVNGRPAVAREVLIQFVDLPAAVAAQQAVLERQIDADQNISVGRSGVRRLRSRTFDVETLLAFLSGQAGILNAEPNYIVSAVAIPDDPKFPSLWGLLNTGQAIRRVLGTPGAHIDAPGAWDVSTGSRSIAVGVIDSGVDYSHPDLRSNLWSAPRPFSVTIAGSTVQCPAGANGFNAITHTCDPMDDGGHGTHVSGTIGATGNNGIGITGVNWTTSIVPVKMLDSSGLGTIADAIDAIDFLMQAKATFGAAGANIRVVNASWGGAAFSATLQNAIADAAAHDMLVVAAAGNQAADIDLVPYYPASYPLSNVLAVASTTNRDSLSGFSNYGATSVDLAAPGSDILSTSLGGGYEFLSGSSMATPHVTGAAALALSVCPLDTAALKTLLLSAVDPVPALTGVVATGGRLNIGRAIRACASPSVPAAPSGLAATAGTGQIALTWQAAIGATTYNVKRSMTAGGPYDVLATGMTVTHYTDTAVTPGQPYFYVVTAVNALGESPASTEVSATSHDTINAVPARPRNLQAVPADAKVRLTWTASPDAIRYRVKRSLENGGPFLRIGGTREPGFVDKSVINGTKYYYVVTAVNEAGESAKSNRASALPAPVPVAPVATATQGDSPGEIDLQWLSVEWATHYRVRRSTTSGGPYFGVRKITASSFTDSGLTTGQRYFYIITALNASGESTASREVGAVAK